MWIKTADEDMLINVNASSGVIRIEGVDQVNNYCFPTDEDPVAYSIYMGHLRIGGFYSTHELAIYALAKLVNDIQHDVKVIEVVKGDLGND